MKVRSLMFILFASILLLLGPGCKEEEFGSVKFANKSLNPYELIINNKTKGEISGFTSKTISLEAGYYELKAEQVSGFILFPTIKEGEIWVKEGDLLEWTFP